MWENFQILFLVHIFIVDETKFVMSDVSKKKDERQTLNIRFEVLEILLKVNVKKGMIKENKKLKKIFSHILAEKHFCIQKYITLHLT